MKRYLIQRPRQAIFAKIYDESPPRLATAPAWGARYWLPTLATPSLELATGSYLHLWDADSVDHAGDAVLPAHVPKTDEVSVHFPLEGGKDAAFVMLGHLPS